MIDASVLRGWVLKGNCLNLIISKQLLIDSCSRISKKCQSHLRSWFQMFQAYIMNDTQSLIYWVTGKRTKQTQFISLSTTFLVSALVHEYVIVIAAGFFYPILFFMFTGFGFWFMIFVQNNRFERCVLNIACTTQVSALICMKNIFRVCNRLWILLI